MTLAAKKMRTLLRELIWRMKSLINIFIILFLVFILQVNIFASENTNNSFYFLTPDRVLRGYKNKTKWLIINTTGSQTGNKYLDSFEIIIMPLFEANKVKFNLWTILVRTISQKNKKTLLFYTENDRQNDILVNFINENQNDMKGYDIILIKGGVDNFILEYKKLKQDVPDIVKKAEDYDCGC
jgi:hypothetical protein